MSDIAPLPASMGVSTRLPTELIISNLPSEYPALKNRLFKWLYDQCPYMNDIGDIRMPANNNSYCYVRYHSFESTFNALKFNKRTFLDKIISIDACSYGTFLFEDIKFRSLCTELRISNIVAPKTSMGLHKLRTDIIIWLYNTLENDLRSDISYTDRWGPKENDRITLFFKFDRLIANNNAIHALYCTYPKWNNDIKISVTGEYWMNVKFTDSALSDYDKLYPESLSPAKNAQDTQPSTSKDAE